MKKLIFILIVFSINVFAQSNLPNNLTGVHQVYDPQLGVKVVTNPLLYNSSNKVKNPIIIQKDHPDSSFSTIRYSYAEPVSIGEYCAEAGNGSISIIGWYLNNMRTSGYGNTNSTPVWQFPEPQALPYNYVAVSENANFAVSGFYHNIYLLNGSSGSQVWSYSISYPPDTMNAGPVAITSTGSFIVGSADAYWASDTSYVYGFNSSSNVPVWTIRVPPLSAGSGLQGIKISGNDSLAIVNYYSGFFVIRTYTGQIIYTGSISGTQGQQGISGNGNIIATMDYYGYVKVYQWNGSTYNLLWQNQEPPGTYYNWIASVDVSIDGSMVAAGTLNFLSSSTYDGKVKFWNISSQTPVWIDTGMGDEVNSVAFSRNGRFLSAASWGNYYNPSVLNLVVFKTSHPVNIPWFAANSPGSFFWSGVSDDGQTVIGSGKAVHARAFGSGGIYYNLYIDTTENLVGIKNHPANEVTVYNLNQNYPNPFNPSTLITYQIPKAGNVRLSVFNVLGQEVEVLVNELKQAGEYNIKFDASDLSSGIYFYKIQSGDFTDSKKMTLIR